jgi:pyruvate carboxylase
MPGGQYTNLREQARSLGLEHRWTEVSQSYADVNRLFGDIVKVTPTSKVVGDMALMMVANDLTPADVASTTHDTAFPESVVSLFKGELGFPPDGFPPALSRKVLKLAEGTAPPEPYRPGDHLAPVDLEAARAQAEKDAGMPLDDRQLASVLMYPKVAREFHQHVQKHGDTSVLPTPTFFYGLRLQDEVALEIDPGKTLLVSLQGIHDDEAAGAAKVQFELNGQSRTVHVARAGAANAQTQRETAEPGNPRHVGAPMPGAIVTVAVQAGQHLQAGATLVSLEAMKMETHITAEREGVVERVLVKPGDRVQAKDLLMVWKGQ